MMRSFGSARPLLAGALGISSMCAGAVLAFRLITPGVVARLTTAELLGLLGLLVLPVAMWWVLALERRAAVRARESVPAGRGAELVRVEIKPMRCSRCERAMIAEAVAESALGQASGGRVRSAHFVRGS